MSTETRTLLDNRFTLGARIGEGTFAEIYRATDAQTGAVVAVKALRPEHTSNRQAIALFQQEGEIGSSLVHPNVVRVLSYGETAGQYFIVMELISGISLRRRMRRATPLSISESVRLIRAVLRGLDAIHTAGYIHRDIKPQNILLEADGTPKITDFGITLRTGGIRARGDGTTLGTAAYIAPEQAAGWELGPPADLYAVGVVLYEMLTGQVPFPGNDPIEVMHRHLYEIPRDPRLLNHAISPALSAVVLRALAKDPDDRFPSATEMHDALNMLHFEELPSRAPLRLAPSIARGALVRRPAKTAGVPFLTSFVGALMLAILVLILALALVSSHVGADDSPHNALQPTDPAGIVVDQSTTADAQMNAEPLVAHNQTLIPSPVGTPSAVVESTSPSPTATSTTTPSQTSAPATSTTTPTQTSTQTPAANAPVPSPPPPAATPTANKRVFNSPPPAATPAASPTEASPPPAAQVAVENDRTNADKKPDSTDDDHRDEKNNQKPTPGANEPTTQNAPEATHAPEGDDGHDHGRSGDHRGGSGHHEKHGGG